MMNDEDEEDDEGTFGHSFDPFLTFVGDVFSSHTSDGTETFLTTVSPLFSDTLNTAFEHQFSNSEHTDSERFVDIESKSPLPITESELKRYPYEDLLLTLNEEEEDDFLQLGCVESFSNNNFPFQCCEIKSETEVYSSNTDSIYTLPTHTHTKDNIQLFDEIFQHTFPAPTPTEVGGYPPFQLLSQLPLPQDGEGDTWLHILLSKSEEKCTELCLHIISGCVGGRKGLDAVNNTQQTALHISCYTTNLKVTKSLLQHGAQPSLLDGDGNSCVHIACEMNSVPLLKCIITTLEGIREGKGKELVNLTNTHGLAPIHISTLKNNLQLVQHVHKYGGNIDHQDICNGKTPLILACETGALASVQFITQRLFADVNIRTMSDYTALHIASATNNFEIVKILLEHGAEVGNKNAVTLKTERDLASTKEVKLLLDKYVKKARRRREQETSSSSSCDLDG